MFIIYYLKNMNYYTYINEKNYFNKWLDEK